MDYKIPEEILSQIPEYFWHAFLGELVSVFGPSVFEKDPESELMSLTYIGGTTGWNAAFKMTCHKLDMDWLYKYYYNLKWWESDLFDSECEDLIKDTVIDKSTPKLLLLNEDDRVNYTNPYYMWLIRE